LILAGTASQPVDWLSRKRSASHALRLSAVKSQVIQANVIGIHNRKTWLPYSGGHALLRNYSTVTSVKQSILSLRLVRIPRIRKEEENGRQLGMVEWFRS
jgi:hypothetical protein